MQSPGTDRPIMKEGILNWRQNLLRILAKDHVSLRQLWWPLNTYVTPEELLHQVSHDVGLSLTPILEKFGGDNGRINKFRLLDYIFGKRPSFACVIPSWNNQEHVQRNLSSVLEQDYWNFRILYINDQSSDKPKPKINSEFSKDFLGIE